MNLIVSASGTPKSSKIACRAQMDRSRSLEGVVGPTSACRHHNCAGNGPGRAYGDRTAGLDAVRLDIFHNTSFIKGWK